MFRNFFRKRKSSDYDPLNLQLTDLKKGFIFEYDLRTWEVKEVYRYDWGDEYFSHEYKVFDGNETRFLHWEEDSELSVSWFKMIKLNELSADIEMEIAQHQRPPKILVFNGITFERTEECPGYFQDEGRGEWVEFMNWDYFDKSNQHLLSIEQWGEREFEASYGQVLQPFEISNITPASA